MCFFYFPLCFCGLSCFLSIMLQGCELPAAYMAPPPCARYNMLVDLDRWGVPRVLCACSGCCGHSKWVPIPFGQKGGQEGLLSFPSIRHYGT